MKHQQSKLTANRYGKHKVRVLKVLREGQDHQVCEIEADILLEGDLEASYLSSDNSSIVPTDTVKNTVHFLAHDHLETGRTAFAAVLGRHFLEKYPHLSGLSVELREQVWNPMPVNGKAHPHAFLAERNGQRFTTGRFTRDSPAKLTAGLRDHLLMKTTGSGFVGYHECDLTTLPPTTDRLFATKMACEWTLAEVRVPDAETEKKVLEAAYEIFASTYSPSVQRTLFQIGEAALQAASEIEEISLRLPNVHYLNLDLSRLGRPDQRQVFLPTDEPHGQIEATLTR
ncbi:MAG: factor-independent urate hydroxylase [Verrucomicrobiota bacterium]